MCNICTAGLLGTSPDGERVYCTCVEGIEAQIAESLELMADYAEQLATWDRHRELASYEEEYRNAIQEQYDFQIKRHDHHVELLEKRGGTR